MIAANARAPKGADNLMSVIGRLDPQTQDVLITPVSQRRDGAEKVPPREPTEDAPHAEDDRAGAAEDESPAARPELPVWLL